MSWVSIVLFITEHLPDLITIINDIIAFFHGQGVSALKEAGAKIEAAIKSGDKENVRQVVTALHAQCPAAQPVGA